MTYLPRIRADGSENFSPFLSAIEPTSNGMNSLRSKSPWLRETVSPSVLRIGSRRSAKVPQVRSDVRSNGRPEPGPFPRGLTRAHPLPDLTPRRMPSLMCARLTRDHPSDMCGGQGARPKLQTKADWTAFAALGRVRCDTVSTTGLSRRRGFESAAVLGLQPQALAFACLVYGYQ